jgi:excisionase family DNA binding protein
MKKIEFFVPDENEIESKIEKIVLKFIEQFKQESKSKDETIFSRSEAAKFLSISAPTLDKYTENGNIKGYRLAGRPVYKKSELLDALKEIEILKYRRG